MSSVFHKGLLHILCRSVK